MDKFDHAIIAQLRQNARASVSAIADEVGLSRS
ncbi:MAG: AsnC family protein, partial [Pseudomonadota bacterium]|nr:AsnC family protein [Pseudomonadota bacterium]